MLPERAAYLRTTTSSLLAGLLRMMLADLASPGSTDSLSTSERMMLGALRPWLPKVERTMIERLSTADPALIERVAGATADLLESVIAYAPGDPLPRMRWDTDATGALVLVAAEP
jgi:hypothetical protein